ncbi:ankyrin repeat domain-containing protein [Streptomyces sp. NPDC047985]|uniref:ankyrin repeat domain-containing protein n=1 Tax=Streptomyces sp. NPDC047985 TaxID=3155384 RepID=UPI0034450CD0
MCAAEYWGHTEAVRELLAHGADPDLREDHGTGRSPLEWTRSGPAPGDGRRTARRKATPHEGFLT